MENDEYKSRCTYCKKEVLAENYIEHITKNSHSSNIPDIDRKKIEELVEDEKSIEKFVLKTYLEGDFAKKHLELKIINFTVENNLSFELGERLTTFLTSFSENHIHQIKNVKLNSKKISNIVSECVKPSLEEKIFDDLRSYKFSLVYCWIWLRIV